MPPVNTIMVTINCYTNPKPRNKIDNGKNLQKLCFISDSHHLPAKYRLLILCTSIRSPYNPPPQPQPTKHEKPASRIRHYPHTVPFPVSFLQEGLSVCSFKFHAYFSRDAPAVQGWMLLLSVWIGPWKCFCLGMGSPVERNNLLHELSAKAWQIAADLISGENRFLQPMCFEAADRFHGMFMFL